MTATGRWRRSATALVCVVVVAVAAVVGPLAAVAGAAEQEAVGTGQGKFWLLTAGLFAVSALCALAFAVLWRRTVPPARKAYEPPDIDLPSEDLRPVVRRR